MNVTVTKPTKKSAVTKAVNKPASKIASSKTGAGGASKLKSAAGKLVKSLAQALKPAGSSSRKTAAPGAVKPSKAAATATTGKAASKTPARAAVRQRPPGTTRTAKAASPAAVTAGANKPATRKVAGPAAKAKPKATAAAPQAPRSGVRMRSNKAAAGITDKIERIVVSKASEVTTKTTKPTSAAPTDDTLLTEAQILKMSEKDYMNAAQRAFFKARLQQLEKDLLKNADETTEHLRETVLVPDPADRATIEEEHALELRTRDRERKLLKKVQQAIASIDSGDYGWCEETGEPIGLPRLLARPTATLSLEAQQRRELKQKLYGD